MMIEKRLVFDENIRKKYAKDHSLCKSVLPYALFYAENTEDVSEIVKYANQNNRTITIWGAGSGVNGGAICKDEDEIVVSVEKINNIEIVERDHIVRCGSGVNTKYLQECCEEKNLFFPPDPASADISSIGGNLACGAGGMRGFKYGTFKDYVLKLTMVTGKGDIVEIGRETLKWVSGYDLLRLLVGSEGTLGIITEATFKLLPLPNFKRSIYVSYSDIDSLVDNFLEILKSGIIPSNAEFMDNNTLFFIKEYLPFDILENESVLLMELDGYFEENLKNEVKYLENLFKQNKIKYIVARNSEQSKNIWKGRKRLRKELEKVKPNVFSEDYVLKYSDISEFISYSSKVCNDNDIVFCNFGHIIDGNIHFSAVFETQEEKEKIEKIIKILTEYVIKKGGAISGEHGIGKYKKDFLRKEIGDKNLEIMSKIRQIFDPNNILNQGKVI